MMSRYIESLRERLEVSLTTECLVSDQHLTISGFLIEASMRTDLVPEAQLETLIFHPLIFEKFSVFEQRLKHRRPSSVIRGFNQGQVVYLYVPLEGEWVSLLGAYNVGNNMDITLSVHSVDLPKSRLDELVTRYQPVDKFSSWFKSLGYRGVRHTYQFLTYRESDLMPRHEWTMTRVYRSEDPVQVTYYPVSQVVEVHYLATRSEFDLAQAPKRWSNFMEDLARGVY